MIKRINNTSVFWQFILLTTVIIISLFISACKQRPYSHKYLTIQNSVWERDDTCIFNIDIQDIYVPYDITFYLRHTTAYPFSNLWLFIDKLSPKGIIESDTISCDIADYTGKWIASGVGSILTLPITYKEQYQFTQKGKYQYRIRQGMRTDALRGVQAVGIKLDYHGKK